MPLNGLQTLTPGNLLSALQRSSNKHITSKVRRQEGVSTVGSQIDGTFPPLSRPLSINQPAAALGTVTGVMDSRATGLPAPGFAGTPEVVAPHSSLQSSFLFKPVNEVL